jgi:hypothetical protein
MCDARNRFGTGPEGAELVLAAKRQSNEAKQIRLVEGPIREEILLPKDFSGLK